MRDFRDAKTMAQTLRDNLTAKSHPISHSESLELVSKMLGVSDWNTLSALLQAQRREPEAPASNAAPNQPAAAVSYPAIPIRDFVPFPTATFPLFVGREKTIGALNRAFERHREVVLTIQKDAAIDEPGFDDVYEIGVLAMVLELVRLPDGTLIEGKPHHGTMKALMQAHRRVLIRRFIGDAGAYRAEIADVSEGPIPEAPELVRNAVERFESCAAAREISMPQTWPALGQIRDPGRVADIIAARLILPLSDKQRLLATIDPVARLEKVAALVDERRLAT
jgi:ATP-dependent Lon protease